MHISVVTSLKPQWSRFCIRKVVFEPTCKKANPLNLKNPATLTPRGTCQVANTRWQMPGVARPAHHQPVPQISRLARFKNHFQHVHTNDMLFNDHSRGATKPEGKNVWQASSLQHS